MTKNTNAFVAGVNATVKKSRKKENETTTLNGARAFKSTLDANVDLFAAAGGSRGKDLVPLFMKAYNEDADLALRNLLHLRDVRGGLGERDNFRKILTHLADQEPGVLVKTAFLSKVAEVGRWDDLLELVNAKFDTRIYNTVIELIRVALADGNGLAAKWMPRKGELASRLRTALGWSPKFYRKTLVNLTKVVETQMCAKNWNGIRFDHVPSKAMSIYTRAFKRNAADAFNLYKEGLANGTTKVNAGAIYPHEIYGALYRDSGNEVVFDAQWKSLPDYISSEENVLPMIDVSSSMNCNVGGQASLSCMDVSISLGMYIAERCKGTFNGMFLTFDSNPKFDTVRGNTLKERFNNVRRAAWGGSTNIQGAFNEILRVAKENNVPQKDMPTYLMILSDMQFDMADRGQTGYSMAKQAYKNAGYELPKIIFWNLNGYGNNPVKFDKEGTALVSGFSPAILKSVLNADLDPEQYTPKAIMLKALMVDRYNVGLAT